MVVHVKHEVLAHHRQPYQTDIASSFCHLYLQCDSVRSAAETMNPPLIHKRKSGPATNAFFITRIQPKDSDVPKLIQPRAQLATGEEKALANARASHTKKLRHNKAQLDLLPL